MPPLTDFWALLGIDVVLCAGILRLLMSKPGITGWGKWAAAVCFFLMWLPAGAAHLPLLAYIRGVSSDLSVTLVALAALFIVRQLFRLGALPQREKVFLNGMIAAVALALYPLSLGLGDWDLYRTGWGSLGLLGALLALCLLSWVQGLRLLPLLIGLSLLSWSLGLMESANLWDYLVDPWLAMAALIQSFKFGAGAVRDRWRASAGQVRT